MVLRRMQSLQGLAELPELPPLPDILDGIELAIGDLSRLHAPPPGVDDVLEAGARALSRVARDIADHGTPEPDADEPRRFTALLLEAFAVERDVVPIEKLYAADDADPMRRPASVPQFAPVTPPGSLELVSLGEHLVQTAGRLEQAPSVTELDLRLYRLVGTLRAAAAPEGDPVGRALSRLARAAREGVAAGTARRSREAFVSALRSTGEFLRGAATVDRDRLAVEIERAARDIDALGAEPIVAIEDLGFKRSRGTRRRPARPNRERVRRLRPAPARARRRRAVARRLAPAIAGSPVRAARTARGHAPPRRSRRSSQSNRSAIADTARSCERPSCGVRSWPGWAPAVVWSRSAPCSTNSSTSFRWRLPSPTDRSRIWPSLLGVAISAGLLVFILRGVDLAQVAAAPRAGAPRPARPLGRARHPHLSDPHDPLAPAAAHRGRPAAPGRSGLARDGDRLHGQQPPALPRRRADPPVRHHPPGRRARSPRRSRRSRSSGSSTD